MNPDIRKQAAVWLVVVFLVGIATGGVFGYSMARGSSAATRTVIPSEAERRAKKLAEMTKEVGLTADQAQKADGVIQGAQKEIRAIREKCEAEVDVVRMRTRGEIRTTLTEEQLPKFEKYVRRMDEERKKQKELQGR